MINMFDDSCIGGICDHTYGLHRIDCTSFTLLSNEYITGYRIYYDDFIVGIIFYTSNDETYSCYDSTVISSSSIIDSGIISYYTDSTDFYYLTGWQGQSGAVLNRIQFEFTLYESVTSSHKIQNYKDNNPDNLNYNNPNNNNNNNNSKDISNYLMYFVFYNTILITFVFIYLLINNKCNKNNEYYMHVNQQKDELDDI